MHSVSFKATFIRRKCVKHHLSHIWEVMFRTGAAQLSFEKAVVYVIKN